MTAAEKISALYEEISALDNERAELEERYCENCQERRCNNCWAELRGKEDENDLPYCGFKNCQYWFDGNCTKPSGQEKCEYWYLLHEEPERKKGKWLGDGDIPKTCPYCHEDWDKYVNGDVWYSGELPNYCPNCGERIVTE